MRGSPHAGARYRPGLTQAALLAALLAGGTQGARAQDAHAGHGPPPATSTPPPVNLGPLDPKAPSIVHTGHEALFGAVLIDQFEYRGGSGSNVGAWEGQAFYGSDYHKVWINTRGEYNSRARALERAEVQLLYSRLIGYFFDAQIGVRHDFRIDPREGTPARTHLVLGVQGLLPNLFELNVQGFINERGTVSARVEASYDAYITQRLVLQPQAEFNVAANADRPARLGAGLTRFETGLRLRYEITREFAPYAGFSYERVVGETSNLFKRAGEQREIVAGVAGIRLLF